MPDYRTMYDADYIGSWDLKGDVTVTIAAVVAGKVRGGAGDKKESKRPVVTFQGAKKKLVLNKTNGKTVAAMYGTDTSAWVGKRVTLYAAKTDAFGAKNVDCVRIRPTVPRAGNDAPPPPEFSEPTQPPAEEGAE